MKPLTKKQRRDAYMTAMFYIASENVPHPRFPHVNPTSLGVCEYLEEFSGLHAPDYEVSISFPEFAAQNPDGTGIFWWPKEDRNIRIEALSKAIDLTYNK